MKLKSLINLGVLIIGLGLTGYSQLNKDSQPPSEGKRSQISNSSTHENWQVKPGSIYDGDTLRVVRGQEELKIRFCGIDAPEIKQPLGIESRDYLRSLIAKGDGTIYIQAIEKDRYNRTVAELWIPVGESQIHLNTAMVEAGYAYHYQRYSGNCESAENLVWAENLAKDEKLGVWNGNHQKPWDWRKANK